MASSSVSQEDVDNSYERLERRTRIRTARARQINPQACRVESSNVDRLPPIGIEIEDTMEQLNLDTSNTANLSPYSMDGGGGGGGGVSGVGCVGSSVGGAGGGGDTSPKPLPRSGGGGGGGGREQAKISTDKRPSKLHQHGNKGKQQRDRRKLREKRRSTGVVHLASTESTGGSTSGEDEESGGEILGLETKRNTQQNETIAESAGGQPSPPLELPPERKNSGHKHHSPLYARPRLRGDKSPRSEDLEADDEQGDKTDNDHDSLNMSQSSSATSMVAVGTGTLPAGLLVETTNSSTPVLLNSSNSTPVLRPATPTLGDPAYSPERCVEENKELLQLVQEKDRRIQYLELRIQQLTQETQAIVEEHSKLKEENSALMKAISSIAKQ